LYESTFKIGHVAFEAFFASEIYVAEFVVIPTGACGTMMPQDVENRGSHL
jgi:hypothetical protein